MYNHYFGLTSSPFAIAPDPGYLYMSPQHRDALAHLLYGVRGNSGFVMLTGEIGTGKTTLCRCMLNHIPEDTDVAFILNPTLSSHELLASICDELHIDYDNQNLSIKSLSDAIHHHLLKAHGAGKNTVLIIDEAQNLGPDVLEQMRLLTNLETNEKKLLQIVMFGQPELRQLIERPELKQLAQRITARFHLTALTLHETEQYINHRLTVAGYKPVANGINPIPQHIIRQIHYLSEGIPRLINIICDRALMGAYGRNKPAVNVEILNKAAAEVFGTVAAPPKTTRSVYRPLTAILGIIFIGLVIYRIYPLTNDWLTTSPSTIAPSTMPLSTTEATTEPQLTSDSPSITNPNQNKPGSSALPEEASEEQTEVLSTVSATNILDSKAVELVRAADIETTLKNTAPAIPSEFRMQKTGDKISDIPEIAERNQGITSREKLPVSSDTLNKPLKDAETNRVIADLSINPEIRAYQTLFSIWNLNMPATQAPCEFALQHRLRCLHLQGNWTQLNQDNRPALVRMLDEQGRLSSQALVTIRNNNATFSDGIHTWKTPLNQLDKDSVLNYTLLWKPPEGYRALTKPGSSGPHILWVKQQLAQLSPLYQSEMNNYFDAQMALYIKAFQRSQNLLQDGVIGPKTLIRLNTLVDREIPLLMSYREP